MNNPIKILAIETSCDETAASVVTNGRIINSNIIASSADLQAQFGGVVPEVAARKHIEVISQVIDQALETAGETFQTIDVIAATYAPGLIGALLVGLNYAKALAYATKKPFVPVHHIHGHIASNYLDSDVKPPFLCLVVSGGHTQLVNVMDYNRYEILGQTSDDAVGEAYDKVARLLELPYPGGPYLDKLANMGKTTINFPRAMQGNNLDFSYSGLKSSVINYINTKKMRNENIIKEDIAASFQMAAISVIVDKTKRAIEQTGANSLACCGGVACNSYLRNQLRNMSKDLNISLHIPKPILCTDNGAMIGASAYYKYIQFGNKNDYLDLNAYSSIPI